MSLKLISATPSAFARMPRIALTLKGIPFTLHNEIPWHSTTITPEHNPLEKLPVLVHPNGFSVYQTPHILNYIVEKFADRGPSLLPGNLETDLLAKQIVALSVGSLDALVLLGWEVRRPEEKQSQLWIERQTRKIDNSLRAFKEYVEDAEGREFVLGKEMTIADIGIGCAVGGIDFTGMRPEWRTLYPALVEYFERLDELEVFEESRPVMFDLTEQVV
jgi:glutathione S-transferase